MKTLNFAWRLQRRQHSILNLKIKQKMILIWFSSNFPWNRQTAWLRSVNTPLDPLLELEPTQHSSSPTMLIKHLTALAAIPSIWHTNLSHSVVGKGNKDGWKWKVFLHFFHFTNGNWSFCLHWIYPLHKKEEKFSWWYQKAHKVSVTNPSSFIVSC